MVLLGREASRLLPAGRTSMAESPRPKAQSRKTEPDIRPAAELAWSADLSETLIIVVSIFGLIGVGYLAARIGLLSTACRRPAGGIRVHAGDSRACSSRRWRPPISTACRRGGSGRPTSCPSRSSGSSSHLMIRRVFGRDSRGGDRRRRFGRLFERRADRHPADAGGARRRRHGLPDRHRRGASADHDAGQRVPERMDAGARRTAAGRDLAARSLSAAWQCRLITHPILIGIALGLLWRVTGLTIPRVAAAIIEPLASSAGPLALVASGMALVNYGIARQIRPAIAISVLKLVLLPVLVFLAAHAGRPAADRRRGADADRRLPDGRQRLSDRAAARDGRGARLKHRADLDRRRRRDRRRSGCRCCSGRSARDPRPAISLRPAVSPASRRRADRFRAA